MRDEAYSKYQKIVKITSKPFYLDGESGFSRSQELRASLASSISVSDDSARSFAFAVSGGINVSNISW